VPIAWMIEERRWVATSVLSHLAYEYDQVGNRKRKVDSAQLIDVVYHYDTDIDPEAPIQPYESRNNRLMSYQTFDAGGLDSTTYYYYNDCGNVTRVVTHEEGTHDYSSTWLQYARNGSTVTYVLGESWLWTGNSESDPTSYTVRYAHEFRYDGARQRYLNREIYPAGLLFTPPVFWPMKETWSDYDGDAVHGDFTADDTQEETAPLWSFEPAIARVAYDELGIPATEHYHGDMIGTTRGTTDEAGDAMPGSQAAYTAFGELVPGSAAHRYGYAGAWGYQGPSSDNPSDPYLAFPFLHVGARYYDPATGRFLQRDPIGIAGGLNVYEYALGIPTIGVDPDGEFWNIIGGALIGVAAGIVSAVASGADATGIFAAAVGGGIAGALAGAGVPAPVAGAIGGAITGGSGAYGQGQGVGGIAASAGVGAGLGAAGSAVAGSVASGGARGAAASAGVGVGTSAFGFYYFDLPASMCGAIQRLPRRGSPGGSPFGSGG